MRHLLGLSALALVVVAGCAQDAAAPAGSGLSIDVAPLSLPGVQNVCYALAVTNEAGEVVWSQAHVCATQYGNAAGGDIAYVGTCDATDTNQDGQATNTVTLAVEHLYDDAHPWTGDPTAAGEDAWQNPCADDAGTPGLEGCALPATCTANADTSVAFNLTVMRNADQGFFDVAVNFADIFCSAKVDCADSLLAAPGGARGPTAVVALACTSGDGATPTNLYLDDVVIDCDGTATDYTVTPLGPGGNLAPQPPGLFQTAVYHGEEQLTGATSCYWNTAVGLGDLGTSCTLRTRASASETAFAEADGAFVSPAGTAYPVIDVAVPLTDTNGAASCVGVPHPLNGGSGVATGYTDVAAAGEGFQYAMACGGEPVAAGGGIAGDPCDGQPDTLEGDQFIFGQQDLDGLACVEHVTGNLSVFTNGVTSIALPKLTTVDGDILVQNAEGLTSLAFPALAQVHDLNLFSNGQLTAVSVPALATVDAINAGSNAALTALAFPALTAVTGEAGVNVASNLALASLAFPALTTAGQLQAQDSAALTSITAPLLQTFTAASAGLYLIGTGLQTLSLPALVSSVGQLSFQQNERLATVSLPLVQGVGGLGFTNDPALVAFDLAALQSIGPTNGDNAFFLYDPALSQCDVDALTAQLAGPDRSGEIISTVLLPCADPGEPDNDARTGATEFAGADSVIATVGSTTDAVDWNVWSHGSVPLSSSVMCYSASDTVVTMTRADGGLYGRAWCSPLGSRTALFEDATPALYFQASHDGGAVGYALVITPGP